MDTGGQKREMMIALDHLLAETAEGTCWNQESQNPYKR